MLQPTKQQIVNELEKVLGEESTREEVADWAMSFINCDEMEIKDFVAWDLLKVVGGLDMIEAPEEYLYSHEDIRKWISDYRD